MRAVHRMLISFAALLGVFVPSSFGAVRAFPEDSPIRALQFVDEKEGWAAGDDGIVLHTIDGGKTWERQFSGTRASFAGCISSPPIQAGSLGESNARAEGAPVSF